LKSVRELVYKRGFAKVNGCRIPITDNSIIENKLGAYALVCHLLCPTVATVKHYTISAVSVIWKYGNFAAF